MTAEQIAAFVAEMEHRFRERTPARSELYASVADRVGRSEMKEGRDPMTASVPERLLAALVKAIDEETSNREEGGAASELALPRLHQRHGSESHAAVRLP